MKKRIIYACIAAACSVAAIFAYLKLPPVIEASIVAANQAVEQRQNEIDSMANDMVNAADKGGFTWGFGKKDKSDEELSDDTKELQGFEIDFLDVGQGNAVLVECDGQYAMIDGGGRSSSSYVVSYLTEHNVPKIDLMIASHYDEDHISGLVGIINTTPVGLFLGPSYQTDTKIFDSLVNAIADNKVAFETPNVGDFYYLGSATFEVVGPLYYSHKDDNDNSIGIRVHYGDNTFLFLGDTSEEGEQELLNYGIDLKSDVYMVSHHGSMYSSSMDLLKEVNPRYAIISVGEGNQYNHPNEKTLARLSNLGVKVYRTDRDGVIIINSDGEKIKVSCQD